MPKTSKRKSNRVTRDDMVIERVELPQAPIVHRSAGLNRMVSMWRS